MKKGGRDPMQIINFGSINVDRTYRLERFPSAGETLQAKEFFCGCGGKGLNQSVAASRAGASVIHAGPIGNGGEAMEEELQKNGVDTSRLFHADSEQGHAIILVDDEGHNEILIHRGSNGMIGEEEIRSIMKTIREPSLVVLQNELPCAHTIIDLAFDSGHIVVFNASPVDEEVLHSVDFSHVHWLLINEVEGKQLTGTSDPDSIIRLMRQRFPQMNIVLTLGADGSVCQCGDEQYCCGSYDVPVADTTGAGDAYTGYFLAGLSRGENPGEIMRRASLAAGISVMRPGASSAIPMRDEVEESYRNNTYPLRDFQKKQF